MKKNNLLYIAICAGLLLGSCNDFLDELPDNRTEINSAATVTALLVSAYPTKGSVMMAEISSDNAMDNSAKFTFENQEHEEAYLWKDMLSVGDDTPKSFWESCYEAIAAANEALAGIEKLGNPANLQAQRGEALMCRAYGHFALANIFCLPYNPLTAESDLGVPYATTPENEVSPVYERGNMKQLFEKINTDIEAGLPLIDEKIYSVPKYHFNKKAAYAFATRFNLYYHNYDKTIQYANSVLGSTPEKVLRNWVKMNATAPRDYQLRVNMYISASEPANLLMLAVNSSWGYWSGSYSLGERYAHAVSIFENETVRFEDGLWGAWANLHLATRVWGDGEKMTVPKIGGYFHYTDKVNGIGYRKNVNVAFTTDETLLCRAEAYALKNDLDKATEDINLWLASHTVGTQSTKQQIIDTYNGIKYMPVGSNSERTPKKVINPRGFTVAAGDQENIIQCLLHLRRIETVHEGLRWQDVKRYGIEIAHNRDGLADDVLKMDDPRRAIQLPQDVIGAGLAANPR